MAAKPSVILMGSKPGAVAALDVLLARGWDVRAVVVSRKFKYPWIKGPTLEDVAAERGLDVVTQSELSREQTVDYVISYMFRYLVKGDVIQLANQAAVNFHCAPLPEFGGWAFYSVAILEGVEEYGCTCHHMDEGFDTGPLLEVRRFPIRAQDETAYSLEQKAQEEMVKLFIDFCDRAERGGELPRIAQDPTRMRYMKQEEFMALKEVPDHADAETVDRYARAFWYPPYECAHVRKGDVKVEVMPACAREEVAAHLHGEDVAHLREIAQHYNVKRKHDNH